MRFSNQFEQALLVLGLPILGSFSTVFRLRGPRLTSHTASFPIGFFMLGSCNRVYRGLGFHMP